MYWLVVLVSASESCTTKNAKHSVPEVHQDNVPNLRQRTPGQVVGRFAGAFFGDKCGLKFVPAKRSYLVLLTSPHQGCRFAACAKGIPQIACGTAASRWTLDNCYQSC